MEQQNATALLERARRFAAETVDPQASDWEAARRMPAEGFRQAAEAGLCGLLVPAQWGGAEANATLMAQAMETLAAADMAFGFGLVVHNNLAGSIARGGSEAQRRCHLPDLVAGRQIGAFLLTEPKGGSDAAALATTATREGGQWVLNGEKAWVTNAAAADLLSVYAQTDPARGWRGIACFLVPADTPGVLRQAPYEMLGGHAMGAGGFRFQDCRIADEALLFPAGEGFKAAMSGIDRARATVAAMCCGMLGRALEIAIGYAKERQAFGRSIGAFQGLQWQLADVATDLAAARLLAYEATRLLDRGEPASVTAAHAKKFATRAALGGIAQCMQAMGANGLRQDWVLARHLACAKIAQYLDGTTEIQNVVIGRSLFAEAPPG